MAEFRCGQDLLTSNVRDAAVGATTVEPRRWPAGEDGSPVLCLASAAAALGADIIPSPQVRLSRRRHNGTKSDANRAREALFASDQDLGGLDK